jgi:hypothetical protein
MKTHVMHEGEVPQLQQDGELQAHKTPLLRKSPRYITYRLCELCSKSEESSTNVSIENRAHAVLSSLFPY